MPRKKRYKLPPKERILQAVVDEMTPTAERATHDELEGSQVMSRVERLYRDGRIDLAGRDACSRFYRDWSIGIIRAKEPPEGGGSAGPDAGELRRLIAAQRFREAFVAVGVTAAGVLEALVCLEWSWARIMAERIGCGSVETAKQVGVICITDLAKWYTAVDNSPDRARRTYGLLGAV